MGPGALKGRSAPATRARRPEEAGLLAAGGLRYRALVGTGGIGSGSFFLLNGDRTLGREESRSGRFLDRRDYCKLHIVSHYVRTLLGAGMSVVPIGRVGQDAAGRQLLEEMQAAGLDLRYVEALPGKATLYSLCFLYPDGSGGNLTTDDSASAAVDPPFIDRAEGLVAALGRTGMAAALPEVPLDARLRLLELAGGHGLFRAASFTSEELSRAGESGLLAGVDLLALNVDEARSLAGLRDPGLSAGEVAEEAASRLAALYAGLRLSITAGAAGSWCWDGSRLLHCPAAAVQALGSAGAGDAHLAGVLAGLACGLELESAQILGTLVAAAAVTSPHTIHEDLSGRQLRELWRSSGLEDPAVGALLSARGEE